MVQKMIRASFFRRDPLTCARELIGTELMWGECSGVVVEVEAYAAIDDEAAHIFTRPSARSFIERNKAGTAYVYFNYRVHWMLNVLVNSDARDAVASSISVSFAPARANSHKHPLSRVEIMRWICAPTRVTASSPTHARL